ADPPAGDELRHRQEARRGAAGGRRPARAGVRRDRGGPEPPPAHPAAVVPSAQGTGDRKQESGQTETAPAAVFPSECLLSLASCLLTPCLRTRRSPRAGWRRPFRSRKRLSPRTHPPPPSACCWSNS